MIICGYCETQNENSNQYCIACGGPLFDDITQRRNCDSLSDGILLANGISADNWNKAKNEYLSARELGVSASEFYDAIMTVFSV